MGLKPVGEEDPLIGQDASVLGEEEDPLIGQDASALDEAPGGGAIPAPQRGQSIHVNMPPAAGVEGVPVQKRVSPGRALALGALDFATLGTHPRLTAANEMFEKVGRGSAEPGHGNYLQKLLEDPRKTLDESQGVYDEELAKSREEHDQAVEQRPVENIIGKAAPAILTGPLLKALGLGAATTTAGTAALGGAAGVGGTRADLQKAASWGTSFENAKEAGKVALDGTIGAGLGFFGAKYPTATGATMATAGALGDRLGLTPGQRTQLKVGGGMSMAGGLLTRLLGGASNKAGNTSAAALEKASAEPRALASKADEALARRTEGLDIATRKAELVDPPEVARAKAQDLVKKTLTKRTEARQAAEVKQVEDFGKRTEEAMAKMRKDLNAKARGEFEAGEKALAGKKGEFEGAVSDLDKRRLAARNESDKGILGGFAQKEKALQTLEGALDADPNARAVSELGRTAKEVYAGMRLLLGNKQELSPEVMQAWQVLEPDFKAELNTQAGKFAEGKGPFLEKLRAKYAAEQEPMSAAPKGTSEDTAVFDMEKNLVGDVPDFAPEPQSLVGDNTRARIAKGVGYDPASESPVARDMREAKALKKYGLDAASDKRNEFGEAPINPDAGKTGGGKRVRLTAAEPEVPRPAIEVDQPATYKEAVQRAFKREAEAKAKASDTTIGDKQAQRAALRQLLARKATDKARGNVEAAEGERDLAHGRAQPEFLLDKGKQAMKSAALDEGVFGGLESLAKGGPFGAAIRKARADPAARAYIFKKAAAATGGMSRGLKPFAPLFTVAATEDNLMRIEKMAEKSPLLRSMLDQLFAEEKH